MAHEIIASVRNSLRGVFCGIIKLDLLLAGQKEVLKNRSLERGFTFGAALLWYNKSASPPCWFNLSGGFLMTLSQCIIIMTGAVVL